MRCFSLAIMLFSVLLFAEDTGRFQELTVNGNLLITDVKTAFVWTGTSFNGKSQPDAITHCRDLVYGSYDDWILPDIYQLRTLINSQKHSPASDFPGLESGTYYSSLNRSILS